ncbi:phosphonoacetaldehyde hydrolase [Candidatus Poribacteria bacterium]|nr:phosphonoacetaldehyde hydrolase [Candidatus Poribacteria bacterium]
MDFVFRRIYRGPVKAVIFDLAGTTVDYGSCAPAGSFIELFKRHDIEITNKQAREPMGMHKKDHIRTILQMEPVSKQWENKQDRRWNEDDVSSMYEEFIPIQLECLPDYLELIPGTLEIFSKLLARNIKIGVTTGYNREMLDLITDGIEKQGFVPDLAICATDVPGGRPAPWMIFKSMQDMNVYPPESVIKIGDTIPDIEAGLNAGVWTVGVAKTGNMLGMGYDEMTSMSDEELAPLMVSAYESMYKAGAQYVVDGVGESMKAIYDITKKVEDGERP